MTSLVHYQMHILLANAAYKMAWPTFILQPPTKVKSEVLLKEEKVLFIPTLIDLLTSSNLPVYSKVKILTIFVNRQL